MSKKDTDFIKLATAQVEAQKALNESNRAFNETLKSNIQFYNTIVRNLVRKFHSPMIGWTSTIDALSIDPKSEFVRVNPSTGDYTFVRPNGEEFKVNFTLLRQDPIAIAQHVRRAIRRMQDVYRENEYKNIVSEQKQAQRALTTAQNKFNESENKLAAAEKRQKNRLKYADKRIARMLAVKQAQREKAQATV